MKIIFFPIDIGIAHIVRSLSIAEELHSRGHKVIFCLPKRKKDIIANSKVKIIEVLSAFPGENLEPKTFTDVKLLRRLVDDELKIIDEFKPDAIVVDYRITALASASARGLKTYLLTHGNVLHTAYIPNFNLPKIIYRIITPIFRLGFSLGLMWYLRPLLKVAQENGSKMGLTKLMKSVDYILPEPEFFYPLKLKNYYRTHYVGSLNWKGFKSKNPLWLNDIHPNGKTLYLTFGGTGYDKQKLIRLASLLVDRGYRVIVSAGTICHINEFPKKKNLYVAQFISGEEACRRVDLVICHGGYGTMIQAVQNKKPVIAIPFNPDQICHALRMQELGVGRCILNLTIADLPKIITLDWRVFENLGKRIDPGQILKEVNTMIRNISLYQTALNNFNKKYPYRDGAKQAADIIEKTI